MLNYVKMFFYYIFPYFLSLEEEKQKNYKLEKEIQEILKKCDNKDCSKLDEEDEEYEEDGEIIPASLTIIPLENNNFEFISNIKKGGVMKLFSILIALNEMSNEQISSNIYDFIEDEQDKKEFTNLYMEYEKLLDQPLVKPTFISSIRNQNNDQS